MCELQPDGRPGCPCETTQTGVTRCRWASDAFDAESGTRVLSLSTEAGRTPSIVYTTLQRRTMELCRRHLVLLVLALACGACAAARYGPGGLGRTKAPPFAERTDGRGTTGDPPSCADLDFDFHIHPRLDDRPGRSRRVQAATDCDLHVRQLGAVSQWEPRASSDQRTGTPFPRGAFVVVARCAAPGPFHRCANGPPWRHAADGRRRPTVNRR
jgi:hypothetical protein